MHADPSAEVGVGNEKSLSIPTDAGVRIGAADAFGAMSDISVWIEWQFDGPVMRQIDGSPRMIVEFRRCRAVAGGGLGVEEIVGREFEIPGWIVSVPKCEPPTLIPQTPFSSGRCGLAECGSGYRQNKNLKQTIAEWKFNWFWHILLVSKRTDFMQWNSRIL